MDKIEDPRIQFYLSHQDEIDEWASIKSELYPVVDHFFETICDELKDRVTATDASARVRIPRSDEDYPEAGLYLPEWSVEKDEPRALICFEWQRGKSDFRAGYVGIACGDSALEAKLVSILDGPPGSLPRLEGLWKREKGWPAIRYVKPHTGYWEDLAGFRGQIVREMLGCWKSGSTLISKAIGS